MYAALLLRAVLCFEPPKSIRAILPLRQGPPFTVALVATMALFSINILTSFNSLRDLPEKEKKKHWVLIPVE